ncbi:hypothetical protein [Ramlibacter albus]|uniref:NnrS family protein n=1 Tax=Ramlibacter albus TaxID=2079448 RepID=A0A923MDF6_9BURK|nr:hypothetical protein [Ramlibacter albus]MBC5767279.1 hypothetical protein [Ramlibacter albus]
MVKARAAASLLVACIAAALLSAVSGGLVRAGVALPAMPQWLGQAVVDHAALMIGAFMGTVIGVERAVALKWRPAWIAPVASAAAGIALLAATRELACALFVLAGAVFCAASVLVVMRQPARHTSLLLLGALCWLAGNVGFAITGTQPAVVQSWFAFLVITIAAERLEMTRLMPRRRGAFAALMGLLALLIAGAAASGVLFGVALAGLAAWFLQFDIARRTVKAEGLSRYMAVCLLGGYGWLALAGLAWSAATLGAPVRDLALHTLGLGFVFSMMLAHAPVILPAVTGLKVRYGAAFYVPLALLHASLALRLVSQREGALANAAALAVFAGVMAVSVSRARARPSRPASRCA